MTVKALSPTAKFEYKGSADSKSTYKTLSQGSKEDIKCAAAGGSNFTMWVQNLEYNTSKGCTSKADPKDSDIRVCIPAGATVTNTPTLPTGDTCACGANFNPKSYSGSNAATYCQ